MSTPEEFKAGVTGLVVRKRIERAEREKAVHEFSMKWEELRTDPIFRVFEDVYTALREVGVDSGRRLENGQSAILTVSGQSLVFRCDREKLRVICTGCGEPEEFELSSLTRHQVEIVVQRFLGSLAF